MTRTPLFRRRLSTLVAGVALLCGTGAGLAAAGATPSAHTPAAQRATATQVKPPISKVLTFMVENHSLAQMRASMPFVYHLATTYAYADHYTAITHPSLPNYLAIVSGGTQGVTDDADPAAHRLDATTVFDQAIAKGKTAAVYADAMTANCALASHGQYAVRHNPWTYFVHSRRNCRRFDVPVDNLAQDAASGDLPNAGMVIPNLVHDAHDATLADADKWIAGEVKMLQAGPDWKSGRLLIVITADEDDRHSSNRVLTVAASRYQDHRVVHTPLTHYSLTRLYGAVLGTPYLGNAATARSMRNTFGITTPYRSTAD